MKTMLRLSVAAAALAAVPFAAPALAQPRPERAATETSVRYLDSRLIVLEQQIAQLLRQSEENAQRVTQLEAQLRAARDEQQRTLAQSPASTEAAAAPAPEKPRPAIASAGDKPRPAVANANDKPVAVAAVADADSDPAEEAYDAGYELWKAKKYEAAIGALRAFTSAFPKHRRVSWANNLAGRALLDDGQPRAAAQVLLANYRSNPKGERAADSLFYLGQSLMKLGQPAQACKAYAELDAIYGDRMRDELKKLLPAAKAKANCG